MRALVNRLGDYCGQKPIAAIAPVEVQPVMLNPRAWPPCKCGGNVNCETYEPDIGAGLWSDEAKGEAA